MTHSFDRYRFDAETGRLWSGAQEVRLTPKASAVLKELLLHAGAPVAKEDLFATVFSRAAPHGGVDSGPPAHDVSAIAVLPFADMSPGRDQDYLCEGLAEELINGTKIRRKRTEMGSCAPNTSSRSTPAMDAHSSGLDDRLSSIPMICVRSSTWHASTRGPVKRKKRWRCWRS